MHFSWFLLALGLPWMAQAAGQVDMDSYLDGTANDFLLAPDEEWKEGSFELPPYPEVANLRQLEMPDNDTSYRYFLDTSTLKPGADGVVRYVLVVESDSGARNVLFEGMQCDESRYRTYAYGASNGEMRRSGSSGWRPITQRGVFRVRDTLEKVYLCGRYGISRRLPEIMKALDEPEFAHIRD